MSNDGTRTLADTCSPRGDSDPQHQGFLALEGGEMAGAAEGTHGTKE